MRVKKTSNKICPYYEGVIVKVDHISHEVEKFNVGEGKVLKIAANAQAFRSLSDVLYSDKIGSIIRELSSNARDAHVEAKTTDIPFIIQLPNKLEPVFKIRDFGTGMDEKTLDENYGTYFGSNKRHTNDLLGCHGLGSKTPFNYVDAFTIINYQQGVKQVYSAHINAEQLPCIVPIHSEPTTELDGLEIAIPVKLHDFHTFAEKTSNFLKYFIHKSPQKVVIQGWDNFNIPKPNYIRDGNFYSQRAMDGQHCIAIMGGVSYPIDGLAPHIQHQHQILRSDFDIEFNIGELDVTLSREKIAFSSKTITNILAKVDMIYADLKKFAQEALTPCKNRWEATIKYEEVMANYQHSTLQNIMENNLIWGSKVLHHTNHYYRVVGVDIQTVDWNFKKKRTNYIYPDVNAQLIHVDDCKYVNDRIRTIFAQTSGAKIYLLTEVFIPDKDGKIDETTCVRGNINDLITLLDVDPTMVKKLSSIQPTKRALSQEEMDWIKNNPNKKHNSSKILRFSGIDSKGDPVDSWSIEKVDMSMGGFYVPISHYRIHKKIHPYSTLNPIIEGLKAIGQTDIKIYGIKESLMEKVAANPKWINIFNYFPIQIKEYINKIQDPDLMPSYKEWLAIKPDYDEQIELMNKVKNPDPDWTFVLKIFNLTVTDPLFKFLEQVSGINNGMFASEILSPYSSGKKMTESILAIDKKYPLLAYVWSGYGSYHLREHEKRVHKYMQEYVDLVNQKP